MTDLQKYLRSEYKDPEYREFELWEKKPSMGSTFAGFVGVLTLCFFIVNFLYLRA